MDGNDDPENLEYITIEEHAERHRVLYEEHGFEQDRIAWLALSGQITSAEATKLAQKLPKTEEWKKAMSERVRGEGNPRYGKKYPHTEEAKEKIRQGLIEYSKDRPEEHQKKLFWKDHKHTEESKTLMSENRKGKGLWKGTDRIPPNLGKKQPDSQKEKVAKALSKDWEITTPSGEKFIVNNLRAWAIENGLDQANLARGGNGRHKGYSARRLDK